MSSAPLFYFSTLLLSVFGVLAAVLYFLYSNKNEFIRDLKRRRRVRRLIARAVPVSLRHAGEGGPIKVSGRVSSAETTLTAPWSGRRCLSWRVTVERGRDVETESGASEPWWEVALTEQGNADLVLRDPTGTLLVRPKDAGWTLPHVFELVVLHEMDLPQAGRALLDRHAFRWEGYLKPKLRFREYIIEDQMQLELLGFVHDEVGATGAPGLEGYRELPTCPVLRASEEEPLLINVGDAGASPSPHHECAK